MSHVFPRDLFSRPRVAVRGEGLRIWDTEGREYIDACSGAAISSLGHGDQTVIRALAEQAATLAFAHTSFFTTPVAEELADRLVANAPANMDRVYFVCDGSEAVETALKMAHQYQRERGQSRRTRIIARRQSYHGSTLGALSAGGNNARRAPFEKLLIDVEHIASCYAYRDRLPHESDEDYGQRAADELEQKILELGPQTVSCFIAETVAGATLGAATAEPGYFRRIREICTRFGVLLILDEVMSGLGRCGTMHACEAEGIVPDLLVLAKGLGAGYQPLGAVLVSREVSAAFVEGRKNFVHGHSFLAHPVACAAALAVQRAIAGRDLLSNVRSRGEQLRRRLRDEFGQHPYVGDIRGRGLLQAIEFVADRDTAEPFAPSLELHARIKSSAMERGLLIYAMGGTIDGRRGNHILLAPPYTVREQEVDEIVDRLRLALADCFAGL